MRRSRSFSSLPLFLAAISLVASCATNPATGRREIMLISEEQEIAMGREYDPQIVASIGLYPDTALQRYVQALGTRIAALSERPRLPWTFRVLDDPTVNAFAVPGGFIYITRGIMAHLDNEAQLASVIGHEIGHVTARHSASQMSREQLAQIGLAVGAATSETIAKYAEPITQGMGVLFLKYSRDDESQADNLGLRYLRRSKHDVREMPDVFAMLAAVSGGGEGGRLPEWQLTHPYPEDRKASIERLNAQAPQDTAGVIVSRAPYLRLLDNVVWDADPRQGYFVGTRFLQPTMRFSLTFPDGWATKNEASSVQAMSAERDAAIQLTIAPAPTADSAQRAFVAQQGVQSGTAQRLSANGVASILTPFAAVAQGDTLRGSVAFVEHGGMVFQLLGYGPTAAWAGKQAVVDRALRSFAVLTDRNALAVQPQRIDIITLDRRSSIAELLTRRPSPLTADALALLNQVRTGEPLPAGTLLKWVVGQPLPR
ncbi:MAG: M48 family metalloprotease [Gemmatimonadetes bacterium]|nr:M48 family metalloprotease [Gemmatimonadota bacterium]